MKAKLAPRLGQLPGKTLAFLDCGKRGGSAILDGIADELSQTYEIRSESLKKSSAHSMASKKLIEKIVASYDGAVYGVVN